MNIIHHYSTPRTPCRIHTRHRILRCDRMQNCDIPTCRPRHSSMTQLTATNQRIDQLLILAFLLDNQCDKCAVWTRFPPAGSVSSVPYSMNYQPVCLRPGDPFCLLTVPRDEAASWQANRHRHKASVLHRQAGQALDYGQTSSEDLQE